MANLTVISSNDPSFQTMLPGMIDYAEQRIYREGDFLATYAGFQSNCVANTRNFTYGSSATVNFLVIDTLWATTSISTTFSSTMTIRPLEIASRQFIDLVYPNDTTSVGVPKYFAPATDTIAILGPTPDQNYLMVTFGTFRPAPLSASNSSTYLTQSLPDLFIAASMIFASGYMRNFGSQADDAAMAVSWSKQYDLLFASAGMEEQRKKYGSQAWQSKIPNPIATPPRV